MKTKTLTNLIVAVGAVIFATAASAETAKVDQVRGVLLVKVFQGCNKLHARLVPLDDEPPTENQKSQFFALKYGPTTQMACTIPVKLVTLAVPLPDIKPGREVYILLRDKSLVKYTATNRPPNIMLPMSPTGGYDTNQEEPSAIN